MTTAATPKRAKSQEKIPRASGGNNNNKRTKTRNNKNNHNNNKVQHEVVFEERIYRGIDTAAVARNDTALRNGAGNNGGDATATATATVSLPVAVRSCWPKLFPTMSSAKKTIRKGIVFVNHNTTNTNTNTSASAKQNRPHTVQNPSGGGGEMNDSKGNNNNNNNNNIHDDGQNPRKGKCDTFVVVGDGILRKLPSTNDEFRNRGPTTNEIVARAIGGNLNVAYLDRYLAVVVKPHGMPVHKIVDRDGGSGVAVHVAATANDNASDREDARGGDSSNKSSISSKVVSMHELLLHCLPPLADDVVDPLRRPAPIHRLDRPTYGLLIVARTKPSARFLSKAFEERSGSLVKRYRAIVYGHLPGIVNGSVDGDGDGDFQGGGGTLVRSSLSGKACLSEYRIVKRLVVVVPRRQVPPSSNDGASSQASIEPQTITVQAAASSPQILLTLVDLVLHTGRKHQLRRHMASLGHPIVGDARYGSGSNRNDEKALSIALSGCATTRSGSDRDCLPPNSNIDTTPFVWVPLLLAAVDITFPHPLGSSSESSSNSGSSSIIHPSEDGQNNNYVMATDAVHSFDASRGTLRVAIDMPESMRNILRMNERQLRR